jgi:hypothetical protein
MLEDIIGETSAYKPMTAYFSLAIQIHAYRGEIETSVTQDSGRAAYQPNKADKPLSKPKW